jgi:hypothetical protein
MEELTLWVMQRVAQMPRAHKFTVGDRLVETCLDVTGALVDASFTRDKGALLAGASRGVPPGNPIHREIIEVAPGPSQGRRPCST